MLIGPGRVTARQRTLGVAGLAALLIAAAVALASCGEEQAAAPAPVPAPVQEQPAPPVVEPPPVQVLRLTAEDLGEHLKSTDLVAGVEDWIGGQQDPVLAALARRALWNDGRIYVPAAGTAGESFWLHVFTDVSAESAEAWVRYLARQPASVSLRFTSPEHMLFEALQVEPPAVGSAALAVQLLHGNAGGRHRTEVIVFSQGAVVVFLRSSRREEHPGQTDLMAIAVLVSERLGVSAGE